MSNFGALLSEDRAYLPRSCLFLNMGLRRELYAF